ncbi:uncharacterized protein LOC121430538 [Lytechinus variegatus]|uniref:uncharacterized protein LOC121430538 n=1 Tax=Lytechinus variegatus TaxID=7654 RepID=UPI001BB11BEB|nr:uncharacterized protein LOC121430538 [Lytechinus variegatus]
MSRKKHQVSMNPSRALQALRRIKDIQPDDLGDLGFILSSETSSLVRCNNHSFTVAMQKQMDIYYRHHVTTMRKLSHGQQSEYRNLIKVKNEKRRMYRLGMLRHREEAEFDYRMKTERDRNDAEIKLLNLKLEDYGTAIGDESDMLRKEADRSGWLRIRRRDPTNSSGLLPTIHDTNDEADDDDPQRDVPKSNLFSDQESPSGTLIAGGDGGDHSEQFTSTSNRVLGHVGTDDVNLSSNITPNYNDSQDALRTSDRLHHALNDQNVQGATEVKAHVDHIIDDEHQSRTDIPVSHVGEKTNQLQENRTESTEHRCYLQGKIRPDDGVLELDDPGVAPQGSGHHLKETDDSHSNSKPCRTRTTGMTSPNIVAIHPVTDLVTKGQNGQGVPRVRRSNEKTGSSHRGEHGERNGIEIRERQAWGMTKRVQKLPSLDLQPIDQVIRYHRHDAGRDLVGTVIAVKPSAEKFPLPSKRSSYQRRKALQWHVEQAPELHKKIHEFLTKCDAVPRPASSLHSRPVFFFSRHIPTVSRFATSTATTDTVQRTKEKTINGNDNDDDLVTFSNERAPSTIHGHSVAITMDMMNRKRGVVTPHK